MLHPLYAAEITVDHKNYPSAMHYVLVEAAEYFGSSQCTLVFNKTIEQE